ncbi:MAG: tellurium resistance protein TerC [Hyphomonas sp.]|jgi:predicted tellurium resistance membrane protein TerC|uniref:Integral membrane protein TerC n=1 Tax=hydrothermal vent metagenome TaxID=652676 RepID=A0A160TYR7_9ZZZZ|nr:tellurium resistance protein TerC [Hyphomonas sp.]MDF1804979.1 tellurium resistance protein TerC [Hyphomonas sp.]
MLGEMLAEVFSVSGLFTLFMLLLLQAVLGFDNLLYISIESKRVGEAKAPMVRQWGIGLAVLFRIVLLFVIVALFDALAEPLFGFHLSGIIEGEFTFQSMITFVGGAFIIYTAIKEISHMLTVEHIEHSEGGKSKSVLQAIGLIVAMNLVFSFDSILSAMAIANEEIARIVNSAGETIGTFKGTVTDCKEALIAQPIADAVACRPGKDYQVWLMAIAIITSGIVMALMANAVADFLKKNRMYEVMGLFILFLVGVLLVTEGAHLAHLKLFDYTIEAMSKSSFYLVIFVLVVTDIISVRYQRRLWAQREAEILGGGTEEASKAGAEANM